MSEHGPYTGKCCLRHRLQRRGWMYSHTRPSEYDRRRIITFWTPLFNLNLQLTRYQ